MRLFSYKPNNIFTLGGPLQIIYSLKLFWIGLASLFGIKFIIVELNYFTIFPWNVLILIAGIWGIIGVIYRCFLCNIVFALFNLVLYVMISTSFYFHPPDWISISSGNYFIDVIGSILLLIIMSRTYKMYRRLYV